MERFGLLLFGSLGFSYSQQIIAQTQVSADAWSDAVGVFQDGGGFTKGYLNCWITRIYCFEHTTKHEVSIEASEFITVLADIYCPVHMSPGIFKVSSFQLNIGQGTQGYRYDTGLFLQAPISW